MNCTLMPVQMSVTTALEPEPASTRKFIRMLMSMLIPVTKKLVSD
jgi:hypothetical protein